MSATFVWPVLVLFVLVNFRKEIRGILPKIRKLKAAGVDVELSEQIEHVREVAEQVAAEQTTNKSTHLELDSTILELTKRFPEAAVIEAFKQLEAVLLQIRAQIPEGRPNRTLNEVLQQLQDKGYVSGSVVELFLQLRKAKNAVAKNKEEGGVPPGEALELVRQIKSLEGLLQQVLEKVSAQGLKK